MRNTVILAALVFAAWALNAQAQDGGGPPPKDGGPPPDGGGKRGKRPPPPLLVALDANGDGVIDEKEIANAPEALKTLDKNGDGKLTPDEYMPPPPPRKGEKSDKTGHGQEKTQKR